MFFSLFVRNMKYSIRNMLRRIDTVVYILLGGKNHEEVTALVVPGHKEEASDLKCSVTGVQVNKDTPVATDITLPYRRLHELLHSPKSPIW